MDRALLDTDILSEVFKNRDEVVVERARVYVQEHGKLTISAVTVMEVVKGFRRVQREPHLERFVSALIGLDVVPFDIDVAVLAGRIYGDLERTGQPIGRADPMIAATAIAAGLSIVTGNVSHYQRIAALGHPLSIETGAHPSLPAGCSTNLGSRPGRVYDHPVLITRPLLLVACLLGCGREVPAPVLAECFSGDYFAECGGDGQSRFGCRADGECKWFVGGVVAEEFVASSCPEDDLCCHDRWPYAEDPDGFEFQSKARIQRELFGHRTLAWDRTRDMALGVAVDATPISAGALSCAGGTLSFDYTPCEPSAALAVRVDVEDTISFLVERAPLGFYAWSLWFEIDPERSLARACVYPYTDDFRRQCYSQGAVVCAVAGTVMLTSIPEPWAEASEVGARVELEFADGMTISGAF
ncbi:MAG TPA: PIN domain-containing protein [Kofleriaceae bacterium]|nr:PIN domain-containing protein [Kofleriaceae bacterium]